MDFDGLTSKMKRVKDTPQICSKMVLGEVVLCGRAVEIRGWFLCFSSYATSELQRVQVPKIYGQKHHATAGEPTCIVAGRAVAATTSKSQC